MSVRPQEYAYDQTFPYHARPLNIRIPLSLNGGPVRQRSLSTLPFHVIDYLLGPFPFKAIRHFRDKFGHDKTSVARFENAINHLAKAGKQIGSRQYDSIEQVKRRLATAEALEDHFSNVSRVTWIFFEQMLRYRDFVFQKEEPNSELYDEAYDRHRFYEFDSLNAYGGPNRYKLQNPSYSVAQEIHTIDLLRHVLKENGKTDAITTSLWYGDMGLGIDAIVEGFTDGNGPIPIDITINPLQKIEQIGNNYVAIICPPALYESPFNIILREQMLYGRFKVNQKRIYEGIRELPTDIHPKYSSFVRDALVALVDSTQTLVLPILKSQEPYEATTRFISTIKGIL